MEPPNSFGGTHIFHTPRGNSECGTHLIGGRQTVCERVERRETHRPNRERHRETHGGFKTHADRHVEGRGL